MMKGPFVTHHQFGVGAMQGYHPMSQFGQVSAIFSAIQFSEVLFVNWLHRIPTNIQDSSASTLPQQPFTNSSHFTQVIQSRQ